MNKLLPIGWLLGACVWSGCASVGDQAPHGVNLSGEWQLNPALSEDPVAMLRAQRREERHGGWNGRRPPGGGGLERSRMPRDDDSDVPRDSDPPERGGRFRDSARNGPFRDFLERPTALSIKQASGELDLVADGVHTEYEYGEKVSASVASGVADRVAGWNGGSFEVNWHLPEGLRASRSYSLQQQGKQLVVVTDASGGGERHLKFRTVYERASP